MQDIGKGKQSHLKNDENERQANEEDAEDFGEEVDFAVNEASLHSGLTRVHDASRFRSSVYHNPNCRSVSNYTVFP